MSIDSRFSTTSSAETVLTFGRHIGKTFDDIKRTDVSYCNWVLKQVKPNGRLKEFQSWLQSHSHFATCERCNGSGKVHIM
jgi:hypothetical protein